MKKKMYIILLCIVAIFISGCSNKLTNIDNSTNNTNQKDKQEEKREDKQELIYIKTLVGNLNDNVKIIHTGSRRIVLNNNTTIEYNFDKLYQNNTNYKEIENTEDYTLYKKCDLYIADINICIKDNTIFYVNSQWVADEEKYHYDLKSYISNPELINNEDIIALYYLQNPIYIKTNKAYYILSKYKTNKEECEKYEDIKCEYSYKLNKDETLTKYYNDIKYLANYIDKETMESNVAVIFKDNKLYSYDK